MTTDEMLRLFEQHRDAERARDYDAVLDTFTEDCYLDTIALGTHAQGREAARAAYVGYFTAFPDLSPEDEGFTFGDDVLISWGHLNGTNTGEWVGVAPGGGEFHVPFVNITTFADGKMAGESIYFDLLTLCEQAGVSADEIRAAVKARAVAN